jgi:hypothetical protein
MGEYETAALVDRGKPEHSEENLRHSQLCLLDRAISKKRRDRKPREKKKKSVAQELCQSFALTEHAGITMRRC